MNIAQTVILVIYTTTAEPEKLLACILWEEKFYPTRLPGTDAERSFIVIMPTTGLRELDQSRIKIFALSELRWPPRLPVFWDDTGEEWRLGENAAHPA